MKLRLMIYLVILFLPIHAIANPIGFVIGKDKTKINITIPEGYCLLNKSEPSDNRVLTTFDIQAKGKHRRLAFIVNCEQLKAWRKGDLLTIDDFGYVLLPEEYVDQISSRALDQFLNDMVDEIGHGRKNIIRHRGNGFLEKHIEERVTELEHSTSVDLGLIHRDNFALYTASLDKITSEIGEQKLMGKVSAITQVNGLPLFLYWFRKLDRIDAITETESDLSKWVISVHRAN